MDPRVIHQATPLQHQHQQQQYQPQPQLQPQPVTASSSSSSSSSGKGGSGSRVSLACLPCRTRHVRCDAKKPQCDRCSAEGKECLYAKSRRGGLDRAALAARRSQAAAALSAAQNRGGCPSPAGSADGTATTSQTTSSAGSEHGSASGQSQQHDDGRLMSSPFGGFCQDTLMFPQTPVDPAIDKLFAAADSVWPGAASGSLDIHFPFVLSRDPYIDMYYKNFHRYHPCVLPRRYMERYLQGNAARQAKVKPLLCVMRLIGSLYMSDQPSVLPRYNQLEELLKKAIDEDPGDPGNYFMAQCHILYSVAIYWGPRRSEFPPHRDAAVKIALDSGMYRHDFATENGAGDAVLEESWRRTWWQIYLIDANYAAMNGHTTFATHTIPASVDLPCEEDEYESGNIPRPKTLEEFNCREFSADDHIFSSFAYLIGAMRDMATVIDRVVGAGKGLYDLSNSSLRVLESLDAVIHGWMLLLPESKRSMLSKGGEVDELIFQALMILYGITVSIHRPFSECAISPVESISSCSPDGSPDQPVIRAQPSEFKCIHTARCIRGAVAQVRLLALPVRANNHTPFSICMLMCGTMTLLSACKFLLRGQNLTVAREQIRATMGYFKSMSRVWVRAEAHLREVQTIAREVLGIGCGPSEGVAAMTLNDMVHSNSGGGGGGGGSGSESISGGTAARQPPPRPSSTTSGSGFNENWSGGEGLFSISMDLNLQAYWELGDVQQDGRLYPEWMRPDPQN